MKHEDHSRIITNENAADKTKLAYVRVSGDNQSEARQLEAFRGLDLYKIFIEKVSAKDTNRPMLQAMLDFVRDGDTVHIHDFSRLARSCKDLLSLVERLQAKNVRLVSNKESCDTSTANGRLMLTLIGAINAFERENLLERQREGIAIAVREGRYKGRKAVTVPDFNKYYTRYMERKASKAELARELNISRPTLDKLITEHKQSAAEGV